MHSNQPKDHSNFAVGRRSFDFHKYSHGQAGQVVEMFAVGRVAGDQVGAGVAHNLEAHIVAGLVVGVLAGRSFARMKFGLGAGRQVDAWLDYSYLAVVVLVLVVSRHLAVFAAAMGKTHHFELQRMDALTEGARKEEVVRLGPDIVP